MVATRYLRFNAAQGPRARHEFFERLLARAEAPLSVTDWRAQVFHQLSPATVPLSAGPAAAFAHQPQGAAQSVCLATAVSYTAELSNVRMTPDGVLSLEASEARELALDFNRVWVDAGVELMQDEGLLIARFEAPLRVVTFDPQMVAGQHLESYLPSGEDGASLRRLMSEIEMWLHEHAVNRARMLRRLAVINGLWLWGAGEPLRVLPAASIRAVGNDVLFSAYKVQDAERANLWVTDAAPGTPSWLRMESTWLGAAISALQRGSCRRITLCANERSVELKPHWQIRFWRRTRPWWQYFE